MNVNAMLELAAHMETMPESNFSMFCYAGCDRRKVDLRRNITLENRPPCGTTFCIAGEKILLDGGSYSPKTNRFGIGRRLVVSESQYASDALGLDREQGTVFFDSSIRTPKAAAARLRALVAEHQAAQP